MSKTPPVRRKTAYSSLRRIARGLGLRLTVGKPVTVNHVRYVKRPAVDPVSKAIAMAKQMGRADLVERLER